MATTTPNNGWPVPTSTDLVKDGATAIEALGDAIDATLGVYGAAGLVKLNTTTFTASSAVNINNVFSATYSNYRIVYHHTKSTNSQSNIRLRVSGADETASNYGTLWIYVSGTTLAQYQVNTTTFNLTSSSTSSQATVIDMITPFDSNFNTLLMGQTLTGIYATNPEVATNFGRYNANTSYTGFSIIPNAGTITGSVTVYGYSK
jgi:hypothetical protein